MMLNAMLKSLIVGLVAFVLAVQSFRLPTSIIASSRGKMTAINRGIKSTNPRRRIENLACIQGGSAGSIVKHAANMDEFKRILSEAGDKLVAVDFTAAWCGPCKMIGPVFNELSKLQSFSNVVFVKIDVDEAPDVATTYKVRSMPTFVFIRGNKVVSEFSGASPDKLRATLTQFK
jgi:thioredoxin 1